MQVQNHLGSSSSSCFLFHSISTAVNGFGKSHWYISINTSKICVNCIDNSCQPWKTPISSCIENTHLYHTYSFSYIPVAFACLVSILFSSSGPRNLPGHQSALVSMRCILTRYRLSPLFPSLAQLPFYSSEWGFPCKAATSVCCRDGR